jgi:AraC-like DNA-binding protein
MSRSRHDRLAVRATAVGYTAPTAWRPRPSLWGQLVWSVGGAVTVELVDGSWHLPPDRALWLPPGTPHRLVVPGRAALHTLWCAARLAAAAPRRAVLVARGPLLVALTRTIAEAGGLDTRRARDRHLAAVLIDELRPVAPTRLAPTWPTDARARRAAQAMVDAPSRPPTLAALARRSAASPRTLARLFRAETGLGIAQWGRRVRLAHAADRLAAGATVTQAAAAAGYEGTSAFVAAFRRATGRTPGRYAPLRPARAG